ncbi:hypothetical protein DFH11DRAFT_1598199 [Phellopilus nigrolimitatus]|nr:hypothetical protein DFH11DRAFT_1598199 [Phellopilus nigrolimitatus]
MDAILYGVPTMFIEQQLSDEIIGFQPSYVLTHLNQNDWYDEHRMEWIGWPKTEVEGKEVEVAEYLNKLADFVRSVLGDLPCSPQRRVYSGKYANIAPSGHASVRKPDIVIVDSKVDEATKNASWAQIQGVAGLKCNVSDPLKNTLEQLAQYVRLCYGNQYDRRFVMAFGIFNTNVSFYYFDRSGVYATEKFDAHAKPELFLRVVMGLLFADRSALGYDPSFTSEIVMENEKEILKSYVTVADSRLEIIDVINQDCVIRGRGTLCLKAKDENGNVLVVKDSWVDQSRRDKEFKLLAKVVGIKSVAQLVKHEHVNIDGKPDNTSNARAFMTEIIDWKGEFVERWRTDEKWTHFNSIEFRDHYRISITPFGDSLEDFDSLEELVLAGKDIVEAIEMLYKQKILHRDISMKNIILARDTERGTLRRGVLIDLDYALDFSEPRTSTSKGDRTGTLPYMAARLLTRNLSEEQDYYHDLESLFYVYCWICCTFSGPHAAPRFTDEFTYEGSEISKWCARDVNANTRDSVGTAKVALMSTGHQFLGSFVPGMALYFKPLVSFLQGMRMVLFPPESRYYPVPDESLHPVKRPVENVFASFKAEFDTCLISLRQKSSPQAPSAPNVTTGGSANRQTVRERLPYILKTRNLIREDGLVHLRTANDAAKAAVRVASKKSGGTSKTFDKAGLSARMTASQTASSTAVDSNTASKALDSGSQTTNSKNRVEVGNSVGSSSSRKRAMSPGENTASGQKRAKKDKEKEVIDE